MLEIICPRCEMHIFDGQQVSGVQFGETSTVVHAGCAVMDDVITTIGVVKLDQPWPIIDSTQ